MAMSVEAIKKTLDSIEATYKLVPRNEYEATNRFEANTAKLHEAQALLEGFSGEYIDGLRARAAALAQTVQTLRNECQASRLSTFDFELDNDNKDVEEELERAERLVDEQHQRKKKPKKGALPKEKKKREKTFKDPETEGPTAGPASRAADEDTAATSGGDEPAVATLADFGCASSLSIPLDVLEGEGECRRKPGTAMAVIRYKQPTTYDEVPCLCRVELYRCVLVALCDGTPLATSAAPPQSDGGVVTADAGGESESESEGGGEGDDETGLAVEPAGLSDQLVAAYNAQQDELEQQELGFAFPSATTPALNGRIRSFSNARFVILLCHGGYFAGGVFEGGACLVHKAFQRYVVRKKQGGKQSSSAKDVGSYNSVGSQIRAAQEVKWKEDVCEILLSWKEWIDGASVILYAAPGPQNRAVLTDFTQISAAARGGGKFAPSPVQVRDPRVHKVPLTTHRPNFEEVQRIFQTVSVCTISYVANQ